VSQAADSTEALPQPEPSPRLLQAALRRTTEHLAHELARPGGEPPAWSALEWRMAQASAAIHGTASLLSSRLRWLGPPAWQRFLCLQRAHTQLRHGRLMHMLAALGGRLEEAGVAAVALKGSALHALGMYAPGERPMADLDILVRETDQARAGQVLEGLGLASQVRSWKEHVFAGPSTAPADALGEHGGRAIKVELHTRILERLPWQLTDITPQVFPAGAQPGLNPYASPAALMTHLVLHAAGCMVTRSLRLLHLYDLAQLAGHMSTGDWCALLDLRTSPRREGPWWALPPLALTERYFGPIVPQGVIDELAARSGWALRMATRRQRLSDVSHSQLWIEAFPGVEWSRSVPVLLAFMYRRLRPDEATLECRAQTQGLQDWSVRSSWCLLSQRQRLLRWLTQRPMRPAGLHCVRAALAQA
jgi:hypothetical protein